MTGAGVLRYCLQRKLTFAAFRVPGSPPRLWVQRTAEPDRVVATSISEADRAFVVAPFFSDKGHVSLIRPDVDLPLHDDQDPSTLSLLNACAVGPVTDQVLPIGLDRQGFIAAIAMAKKAFIDGGLKKVVLARGVEVGSVREQRAELFFAAGRTYPSAFVSLVHTPGYGTWIGASPERLITVERGRVEIDALAATLPAGSAPDDVAEWSAKERDEQEIVTRTVLQRLEEEGIRDTSTHGPVVKRIGKLAHLHTIIRGPLGSLNASRIVASLHPTPAVCGEPTDAALDFIRAHEPQDRSLYAGYWGPWGIEGRTDLYVNIRCMQVIGDRAVIHAGAGITSGSDPEREWAETELKTRAWLDLIETQPRSG